MESLLKLVIAIFGETVVINLNTLYTIVIVLRFPDLVNEMKLIAFYFQIFKILKVNKHLYNL
jgi:hypothetical protein